MMTLLLGICLAAGVVEDKATLQGIKDGKVVYDVTDGDGKALLNRLDTIDETRRSMLEAGTMPHFVISFRGPATKLVQTDMEVVKPEDREYAAKIAKWLAQFSKEKGVESLEQCAVAIRHAGTKPENVVTPIKVVQNSFVTLMAYQSKGYAYIRP
jgi:intracellular sulfur oxidation DsrE/DsrF family protein